jgi:hypothetical protein
VFFAAQCFDCKRFDARRAREARVSAMSSAHRCSVHPYGIPLSLRSNREACPDFIKRKIEW